MDTGASWKLLVGAAVCCACFLWKYLPSFVRTAYLSSKIPSPSLWKLVTVHAKGLLGSDVATYVWKMCAAFKHEPWGLWTQHGYLIFVSDCETVGDIHKNKYMIDRPDMFLTNFGKFLGEGLMTLKGPQHRLHRKLVSPIFRKSLLESQMPWINKDAAELVRKMREKASGDIVDLRPLVDDQVGAVAISILTAGSVPSHLFTNLFHTIVAALAEIHLQVVNPFYYWLVHKYKNSTRKLESTIELSLSDFKKIFRSEYDRVLKSKEGVDKSSSGAEVMVQGFCSLGVQDVFESVYDEVRNTLAAAHETTAFTMNASLLMLALHQDVQQQVFEELETIFGSEDRPVEPDDLPRMEYMEMFIKESLRLFPPASLIGRTAEEETEVNGVVVPKGANVSVNIMAVHRDPKVYEDPLRFDPERFSAEACQGRHLYAFIPFGIGFRMCPGQVQAMMMLKTLLCHVVRNFKILPAAGFETINDVKTATHFTLNLCESPLRLVCRNS